MVAIHTGRARTYIRMTGLLLGVLLSSCMGAPSRQGGAPLVAQIPGLRGQLLVTSGQRIGLMRSNETAPRFLPITGGWPAWSPDGKRIAFTQGNASAANVYVMDVDGSGVTQVTTGGGLAPVWSPDGRSIAYTALRPSHDPIFVMDTDGSHPVQVSTEGGYGLQWSPMGDVIAYHCDHAICIASVDGTQRQQLTTRQSSNLTWSPTGDRIAFIADEALYIADADGSHLSRITPAYSALLGPVWSPDGTRIAFLGQQRTFLEETGPAFYSLYTVSTDGSVTTQLTDPRQMRVLEQPAWSPDSSALTFISQADDPEAPRYAYIVKADGSAMQRLIETDSTPLWQPQQE